MPVIGMKIHVIQLLWTNALGFARQLAPFPVAFEHCFSGQVNVNREIIEGAQCVDQSAGPVANDHLWLSSPPLPAQFSEIGLQRRQPL